MKDLLNEVSASVFMEYERAAEKFGKANNSHHESYAVILEEFEEATEQEAQFATDLKYYWQSIKLNDSCNILNERLDWLKQHAEKAAAKWIQVAAMCYKAEK